MEFVDTHCHIHFPDYALDPDEVVGAASQDGVKHMIVVGCTLEDSEIGTEFIRGRPSAHASIGLHPHEAKYYVEAPDKLQRFRNLASKPGVIAIGETGLDHHYNHSPKADQEQILRFQIDLALKHDLPLIFHVREAFDDFWRIYDEYRGLRGVVHSFSSDIAVLDEILSRKLYVGLNGIMTFTKDENQLAAARAVPLERLLLETDAPFLTPTPYRGTICQPKHVVDTANFLSRLRGETLEQLAAATTKNAKTLFNL